MRVEDGALHPVRAEPHTIAIARRIHADHDLADVLDWHERGDLLHRGDEDVYRAGRPLAHAFLRFLLERTPGTSLLAKLRRIHAMPRAELLALESPWRAWLVDESGSPGAGRRALGFRPRYSPRTHSCSRLGASGMM